MDVVGTTKKSLCLIAVGVLGISTTARATSSLLEQRQKALVTAVKATKPRSQITLTNSIRNLATKTLERDAVLGKCARGDCELQLGGTKIKGQVTSVYLFGDSHMRMWLPAIYQALKAQPVLLRVSLGVGCPVAQVTLYGISNGAGYGKACNDWREQGLAKVLAAKPNYVILAERTSTLFTGPDQPLSGPVLTSGLTTTIRQLQANGSKVVIIGDTPPFANWQNPSSCVTLNLSTLSNCSTSVESTTPYFQSLGSAEAASASATNAYFIDPTWWLCERLTKKCPAVVDDKVVYLDSSHISYSTSVELAGLMAPELRIALHLGL